LRQAGSATLGLDLLERAGKNYSYPNFDRSVCVSGNRDMNISDLFSTEMEPQLSKWVHSFTSLDDLFSALPQLYAKLQVQTIRGHVDDGAQIIGPVHIGIDSVVHGLAIIRGPSIVGRDTVVHSHANIESDAFIGSQCVIGHSSSIARSVLMGKIEVCAGAFIRNSVLGTGSVVGPGAVLGAVEVDRALDSSISSKLGVVLGDYVVIGAKSIIKPGTVIGANTIVGEGVLASGMYEANQTVTFGPVLNIQARYNTG
jgi:UDP-3-O-[3-hydroxymyristoyl] glucosamine N-acyltransferase